jgi:putative ABC transport system ATP-binding protein
MIQFQNVIKSYKDPSTGLENVILDIENLKFNKGEQYGLFGPSGSGKTTLLHLVSGLITPDKGTVHVNNIDITSLSESKRDRFRADHIGYVFQSFNLLDGFTALENVMLAMVFSGNKSDKDKAMSLLDKVGLKDRVNYKPSQLSMGQQQRVCIARALINDPDVLLADEPTGNLDQRATQDVLQLLMDESKDRTLLLVTHESEVLQSFSNKIDLNVYTPQSLKA